MTRSNRRVCRTWSKSDANKTAEKTQGHCLECEAPLVQKQGTIYVCMKCGLEQEFNKKPQNQK